MTFAWLRPLNGTVIVNPRTTNEAGKSMARPYVKRQKVGIRADLISAYRAELHDATGKDVSAARACEIALDSATKLRQGHYDEKLREGMYANMNRLIAEKIAEYMAFVVQGTEASTDADGWPMLLVRTEGDSTIGHPIPREFIKPAAPTVQ